MEQVAKRKWTSRKFLIVMLWSMFVAAGIFSVFIGYDPGAWLPALVTMSGAMATAFIGTETWRKGKNEQGMHKENHHGK